MTDNHKILLINRSEEFSEVTAKVLIQAGYIVKTAMSLKEALSILSSDKVELIICDNVMQDITGRQFLKYLKSDPIRNSIPFVFFVPLNDQGEPLKVLEEGAVDYIVYPLESKTFLARIKNVLQQTIHSQEETNPAKNNESITSLPFEAPLPSQKEQQAIKESLLHYRLPVELSPDGQVWMPANIVDYNASHAFVETPDLGKIGESLIIKCSLPRGMITLKGHVEHIICDDCEKPIRIDLDFQGESQWQIIYEYLQSIANSMSFITPDETPASRSYHVKNGGKSQEITVVIANPLEKKETLCVELSPDGQVWMPGYIVDYNTSRAFVETPVLGKIGENLKLKCSLSQGAITLTGHIARVIFDDFDQPVGIGLDFQGESRWQKICEHIDSITNSGSQSMLNEKTFIETHPPVHLEKPQKRNMMIDNANKKNEALRIRFYQSLIGKQLDQYKVVSFLGAGAMGGVFKGWDTTLERDVAIKVISHELSSQDAFVDMFIKEARFVSKLNHPNISHMYSIGNTNHILYCAMEFITGDTLSSLIKKHGNLNFLDTINYFITVCQTLDYVSKEHIIHRDIKPENIIVNEEGQVKLVDFGVAKRIDMAAPEGKEDEATVGSPLYISPASILGQRMDHRSDIYSLGATFYHVFSGFPPYKSNSVEEVLYKHLNECIPPLKVRNPKVSSLLCNIIEKMLQKNPDDRYQNYKDIISELQSFQKNV